MEPLEPRKLCEDERQRFIDCMFVHSHCVQSGRLTFTECMEEHSQAAKSPGPETARLEAFPVPCAQIYQLYIKCRSQMVGPRSIMIAFIAGI